MALGRNHRMESRRSSSSYCSTVSLVLFVGMCLIGVWMMTSSTIVPVNLSTSEPQSDVKSQVQTEKLFKEGPGELFEGGINDNGSSSETSSETSHDQEETPPERSDDRRKAPDDSSPTQAYDDTDSNEGQSRNEELDQGVSTKRVPTENSNDEHDDEQKLEEKFIGGNAEGKMEDTETEKSYSDIEEKIDNQSGKQNSTAMIPDDTQLEMLNETNAQNGSWSTQATESTKEKKSQETLSKGFSWKLCNVTAGSDYIPCLDNEEAIKKLRTTKHYEHRERHCPEESPTCLVPLPEGYREPIKWPVSRDKIWYFNVPHTKLAEYKGHQNWVKVSGEYLTFPGGGTQFQHGALHYIDFIQEILPAISWGKQSRVVLDVGCGVASFGGYLFERDVLTMSFAPKDEHEAQVQFALERGIPAISAVMGTKRLPFPGIIFDVVHCARCRVPWHIEGGKLLLELNRLLRPGGYFVWSATPVYQKLPEDVEIWNAMSELTKSMCWELLTVKKDSINGVGVAIYRKPSSNECYDAREKDDPPLCLESYDRDAAWNVSLQACMHRVPVYPLERGTKWPEQWPERLRTPPYWLNNSLTGVYGKPAPEDFLSDYQHWKHLITSSYLKISGVDWSTVRNAMDMRSIYGGFAAALRDLKIWVMNVVPIDSPDTLPIIYERGLFGIYHDWCESFSTYPRSYDLLHADHLFSNLKNRCKLLPVVVEVDRVLRPGGYLIMRDKKEAIEEVEQLGKSLRYDTQIAYLKNEEGFLLMKKSTWRPSLSRVNATEASSTS